MSRVFILGAGASRFAGYPLSPDLWKFIRDFPVIEFLAKKRAESVTKAIEEVLRVVPPKVVDKPNLEELFTLLDLAAIGTEPLALRNINWTELRPKVMGMISEVFLSHEYDLRTRLLDDPASPAATVLQNWTSFLREGDVVVTFNWDILHEGALWRAGKWHYADGYGFRCPDVTGTTPSKVKILKLHGSVNWAQRTEHDCEPSIEHKHTFFAGSWGDHDDYLKGAGQWNDGRNLIIPTYLKDIAGNRLLLHLWIQASEALANASEVIVVGYQLYPADAPARQLLGTSLLRNRELSTVLLVSPNQGFDHWDEFCLNIGKTRRLVRKTFEEWIANP